MTFLCQQFPVPPECTWYPLNVSLVLKVIINHFRASLHVNHAPEIGPWWKVEQTVQVKINCRISTCALKKKAAKHSFLFLVIAVLKFSKFISCTFLLILLEIVNDENDFNLGKSQVGPTGLTKLEIIVIGVVSACVICLLVIIAIVYNCKKSKAVSINLYFFCRI